jgi:ribosome-associated heat shock protein Hsp15
VDSWIWSVRLAKTRSAASGTCRAGHVRVTGMRVKPAHSVRAGDEVRLRQDRRERVVVVMRVIAKRAGAPVAAECYVDRSPPLRLARRRSRWLLVTEVRAGRPSANAAVPANCPGFRPGPAGVNLHRHTSPPQRRDPPLPADRAWYPGEHGLGRVARVHGSFGERI